MNKLVYKLVTSDEELQDALEVRRQVFVREQRIAEDLEYDGLDNEALHIVVKDGERVIATARILFPITSQAKIERMAVLKSCRRRGVGTGIMAFLNEELGNRQIEHVILHAQWAVISFYKSCGFKETGLPFMEAGIKHIKMERWL